MRLLILAAAVAIAVPARADAVKFVRVWPRWRDAAEFVRIADYLGIPRGPGTIRRTHDAQWPGYYFLVRVKHKDTSLASARFRLQVITPDSPDPKTFLFPAGTKRGTDVYELGLTGADWPARRIHPVAWRLDLLAGDGSVLASEHSFVWSKP